MSPGMGLTGAPDFEDLIDGPDDPLGLEIEAPDVDAIARRRVAALAGPGEDSAVAAAYWRQVAESSEWGEWAPPTRQLADEELEGLRDRGWIR